MTSLQEQFKAISDDALEMAAYDRTTMDRHLSTLALDLADECYLEMLEEYEHSRSRQSRIEQAANERQKKRWLPSRRIARRRKKLERKQLRAGLPRRIWWSRA